MTRDRVMQILRNRYVGLLLAAGGVGSAFVVVIRMGFVLHQQTVPPPVEGAFPFAVVMLIVALAAAAFAIVQSGWIQSMTYQAPRPTAEQVATDAAWDRAREAYQRDPTQVFTCEHLQPVEYAMRLMGIKSQITIEQSIEVRCVVDFPALRERFSLPDFVNYSEPTAGNRSEYDPPSALIACSQCKSYIRALHELERRPGIPTFPPPSSGGRS